MAREKFNIPDIIARVDNPQLASELQSMRVKVVQPAMAIAPALEGVLHFPAAFQMLIDQGDNVEVLDVALEDAAFDGRPLRKLRLPGDALVVGLRREGEVLVPHGETVVRRGDTLMLVGHPGALQEASQLFSGRGP